MKTCMILSLSDVFNMYPSDPGYKSFHRGQKHLQNENYDRAIKQFRWAIASVPNFAVAYEHFGLAYLMTGDYEQASRQFFYANECRAKRLRSNR